MSRLWDKGTPVDDLVLHFTVGDDHLLDARLVRFDVEGSSAHATMLAAQGYLSKEDGERLCAELARLEREHAAGEWAISMAEEDCHTALENRLVERLGELGKRIHLGRSRNDQVLTALRLYLRHELEELREGAVMVIAALEELAASHEDVALPGYTHMQRAMPSTVALWAGGFAAEIEDDREGLRAAGRRLARCPLGSAAGYGTPGLELDRAQTARLLGFEGPQEPVTAAQLSRGKAEAGVIFELCLLAQDLGRLAADLCLFTTREFALVTLPDAFTTGSSIMPQKRNPDVFELIRARSTQLPADLHAVLGVTSKLPSGYHRDLQLLKPPLFRAIDSAHAMLAIMARAIPEVRFDPERAKALMDPEIHATEEAYALVQDEGIPFREAYQRVAERLFSKKK